MKAITLWQPWASLLACGAKKYETRSWATSYRGPIAIHAGVTPAHEMDMQTIYVCRKAFDLPEKKALPEYLRDLPHGAVIATAELVGCHKIVLHGGRGLSRADTGWLELDDRIYVPSEQEILFGDWTSGRFAWEFTNMTMLPEPIPAKGRQRLWNWNERKDEPKGPS